MKNFGLSDWAWVEPFAGDNAESRRLAVHATDLLSSARIVPTLEEAVSDCVWVVGTTSRRVRKREGIPPRELASRAGERSLTGPVALVFGDERNGLTQKELSLCHDLSSIPTSDEQPSLNLAQAVLLYAYELALVGRQRKTVGTRPSPPGATEAELQRLRHDLDLLLNQAGFLKDAGRHGVQDLFAPWIRAPITARETRLWWTALQLLLRGRKKVGAQRDPPQSGGSVH